MFSVYHRSMDNGSRSSEVSNGAARGTVRRYAHPGHDRIARESLDLRQREDELRGRWREMGFQLPQVHCMHPSVTVTVLCKQWLIAVHLNPPRSYGASPAMRDHTALPVTRHCR